MNISCYAAIEFQWHLVFLKESHSRVIITSKSLEVAALVRSDMR